MLEFFFEVVPGYVIPVKRIVPFWTVPSLAFEKPRDTPDWDWEASEHNRKIERDKERWRLILIDIERQAREYALDGIRQNATCRKESLFGGMEEFGYEVRL